MISVTAGAVYEPEIRLEGAWIQLSHSGGVMSDRKTTAHWTAAGPAYFDHYAA